MVFKTKGLFFQEGDPFGVSNATMIFGVPQAKADLDAAGENLIATAKTMHHLEEELALAGAPYFSSLVCAIEEHDHINARRYRKSILNVRPSQSPFCRTGVGEVVSHVIMWVVEQTKPDTKDMLEAFKIIGCTKDLKDALNIPNAHEPDRPGGPSQRGATPSSLPRSPILWVS